MALPILRGDESLAVVKRLAELNLGLSGIIEALGKEVLQFPGVGLRNGLAGASKTYEVAFVRSHPSLAFATFKAPSYCGTWMRAEQHADRLTVEVRYRDTPRRGLDWLHGRTFGGDDWYTGHLKPDSQIAAALGTLREAYDSFDR